MIKQTGYYLLISINIMLPAIQKHYELCLAFDLDPSNEDN